jgi:hypothetical protein
MPSTPTTRNRLEKQAAGENLNTWGAPRLNTVLDLVDASLDGWTTKALTADYTLTSTNYSADESRSRVLKFTGAGPWTVTIPSFEKTYYIWNACAAALTITTGAGDTASIAAGEIAPIICDASNVNKVAVINYGALTVSVGTPTASAHAVTKAYADGLAFGATNLPGQSVSTVNQFVKSNGSVASWATPAVSEISGAAPLAAPSFTGGITAAGGQTFTGGFSATGGATLTGGLTLSGGLNQTGGTYSAVTAVAALDINFSDNDCQTKSISANTTFTISGLQASKFQVVLLILTITSSAVPSFPAWVDFENGSSPLAGLGNGTHWIAIATANGGTSGVLKVFARNVS